MEMRFIFMFVAILQCEYACCLTVHFSDDISQDVDFLHRTFPVPPSKRVVINFTVFYTIDSYSPHPILGIYTTRVNTEKRCINKNYLQLGNKNLYETLSSKRGASGPLYCSSTRNYGCPRKKDPWCRMKRFVGCFGKKKIQDYTPRNFSFSFGFPCNYLGSLQRLQYNMTIIATNETTCSKLLLGDIYVSHTCNLERFLIYLVRAKCPLISNILPHVYNFFNMH